MITRISRDLSKQLFYLAKVILLAGVYFATAKAGLQLSPVSGFATLVWPPSGIALAALLLFGWRLWPGIFLGAAVVNLSGGAPMLVALGIGVGNTLEPLTGAYLLKRFGFQLKLSRIKDVFLLISCAALISTIISATIGTSSLLAGGTIGLGAYPRTWSAWWIGDMLGILVVTPLILVWAQQFNTRPITKQLPELSYLMGLFLAAGILVFGNLFTNFSGLQSAPYLLLAFMIWATLRFKSIVVITLTTILSAFTVVAAIYDYGPFGAETLDGRLFSSQLFIGVVAVTFLSFSAVMSERRLAQAESHKLNKQLEKSLARRTAQLHKEIEIEKLKDEFVATASHEIKTPITSIKAYAKLLEKEFTQKQDSRTRELTSGIDRQADKLTRFAEELLDVSRIESGEFVLQMTKIDLSALLKKTVAEFQNTVQSHRIIERLGAKKIVYGNQNRLEQVALNLLTNAVKYSPQANKVIVKLTAKNGQAIVSVQDFGPGIPKKDLTKVFGRFYRVADRSIGKQTVSGIGLGLYISSEIIKQHKGKIWAESHLGNGATFNFSLLTANAKTNVR